MSNRVEWGGRGATIARGAVAGFVLSWAVFAVVVFLTYAALGDSSSALATALPVVGLLALPVVSGLLMIPRRTRHTGAGLLMGVAIGSVVGAGVCGAVIAGGGM